MTSILIADDHGIVREGLRRLLECEPDIEVAGEAAGGREVLAQVAALRPDVVVLDITMPRLGGLETLERLRADFANTKVVLFSVHSDPVFVQSAISLGADGYVLENGRVAEIASAIRETVQGRRYFCPAVAADVVEDPRSPRSDGDGPLSLLSAREREVLERIAAGSSVRALAAELGIDARAVEAHRKSLMRKLGVRKTSELVREAVHHGLIES